MATCEQTKTGPTLRRLKDFAGRFGADHFDTMTRWVKRGTRAPNGQRIKLKAVRVPAGWRTTEEWVQQFIEELTNAAMAR
jgi:hypothetical protein